MGLHPFSQARKRSRVSWLEMQVEWAAETLDINEPGDRVRAVLAGIRVYHLILLASRQPPESSAGKMQVLPRSALSVETVAKCNPLADVSRSSLFLMNCV